MRYKKTVKKAVIPVAGLGTRILPATKAVPKEMLPVVDKPLIQYIVEEALASGIKEIILVTRQGKSAIENHFDSDFELETILEQRGKQEILMMVKHIVRMINIISVRQKYPLGLGHAILCAKPLIFEEPFAVLLPDDLVDSNTPCIGQLIKIFEETKEPVVAVERVSIEKISRYGVIEPEYIKERLYKAKGLIEKPLPEEAPSDLGVIGRYVLTPDIFPILEHIPFGRGGELQLTDALHRYSQMNVVYAYEFEGKRYDAGEKLGYLIANVAFGLKHPELSEKFKKFLKEKIKE
ncbi:MAG TPA: UTP--glucose-1-phosphate uridylyltransferase GalU [Candidatus Desulfofervidus auxilii]|uniref:UTP--glucose-1-phosphate uridylyltransferase n=1 Tax=Desulfofervidus auxilii TaxID=1621989 RepID=A0A7V0NER6_DESA2|nr:UTP--glucose-1-phosphate uridylyltransferase GalU [Candidatus Desulfofervidus auxilii]